MGRRLVPFPGLLEAFRIPQFGLGLPIDEEGLIVAGVDPTARAEDLGLDDWAAVAAQHLAEAGGR